jgi:predicted  nucleic acid-binding Zn-ribbon protein
LSVTEMIETLRQLQSVDDGIKAVEDELELLPRNLEAAREDRSAVEERLKAAEDALEAMQKRRRELEQEIQTAEANVVKYETQKIKVKTNEEYQALNTQIAHEKERKSDLEDRVLETFDEEEAAADRRKKMKAELAQVTEAVAAREQELKARSEEDRYRLAGLKQRREELLPVVDPHLLNRYEAIRTRKGGTAVVSIIRGACGGCFTQQPPQKVNEVRKSDVLQTCEFCGRFLVWDAEEATAS